MTPQLFTLTKTYLGPEDETATGPDFPEQYEIDVSVAPGQTITNFSIQDVLPGNIQFVQVDTATANNGSLSSSTLPSTTTPGGLLDETFNQVTGTGGPTDAKVIFTFYVPRDPSGTDGTQTPDLPSGGFTPSPNTATANGHWTPIDPRDPAIIATATSNTVTLTEKSIAIQKSVTDVEGNPTNAVAVGDDLQYALNFQISDFSPSTTWSPPTCSPTASTSTLPIRRSSPSCATAWSRPSPSTATITRWRRRARATAPT